MKAELVELTKAGILNNIPEEAIFAKYMGLSTIDEDKSYINPLRNDKNPSCRFFRRSTDNRLLFNDWSWKTFDCFDYVMTLYGVNFHQAIQKIALDFNLIDVSNVKPVEYKIQVHNRVVKKSKLVIKIKRRNYLPQELDFWNVGGIEVDEEVLRENKIYAIQSFWEIRDNQIQSHYYNLKDTYAYHFHGYNYQIYRPKESRQHRRFINSPDIKVGDLEFLDPNADYVLITKSKKDAFFLRQLGVNVVFIISERIKPTDSQLDPLYKYPNKFTLFDNDITGRRLSLQYKRAGFKPLLYPKDYGKDTYDVLKKYDKFFMIDLINEIKAIYL